MSPSPDGPTLLARDCQAVLVPSGQTVTLPAGTPVVVVQNLGGSFTVQLGRGGLARIASSDADALDLERPGSAIDAPDAEVPSASTPGGGSFSIEAVMDALKLVYDPEIPINVVDLGLVYACNASPLPDGTHRVEIKMSMTAPGCGMGDVLREDARQRVAVVPGVGDVEVELVCDPPWDLSRLSEEARLELGMW